MYGQQFGMSYLMEKIKLNAELNHFKLRFVPKVKRTIPIVQILFKLVSYSLGDMPALIGS